MTKDKLARWVLLWSGGSGRVGQFLRSFKFAVVFGLSILTVFVYVPAIYTWHSDIPPLEQTTQNEGTLSFTPNTPKSGYLTLLKQDNGIVHIFSCKHFATDPNNCIERQYDGKRAVVWWYSYTVDPLETNEHPVRIDVEGKTILAYEQTLEKRNHSKTSLPWYVGGQSIAILIVLIIIFQIQKRIRHAASNG